MAFFKSLKRAFGFDADEIEDDFPEGIDATVTPLKERIAAIPQQDQAGEDTVPAEADPVEPEEETDEARDEAGRQLIFRHAVKIINESLPTFLSSALDPEEQERFLLNALDEGMRQYLSDLERRARRTYDDRWAREKNALDGQFETMREKLRKGEEDGAEAKKQQLSAERQKRALTERVRDLEKQIDSLQAENEQYVLENKSLVNKLRVCAVQDGGSGEVQEAFEAKSAEIERLNAEIEKLNAEVVRLNAETEARQAKIDELSQGAEQAVATHEISQAMVNDLQTRAREAMTRADEVASQLAEVNGRFSDMSSRLAEADALAEQLRSDAEAARTQAEDLRGQLAKARQQLKVVQEVREQIQQLEQDKIANDNELARLREAAKENDALLEDMRADVRRKNTALAQRDAMLRQAEEDKRGLEDLTDSLRKTIETNLHHQAQSEALLRSEIDRLKSLPAAAGDGFPQVGAAAETVPSAEAPAVKEAVPAIGFDEGAQALLSDFSDFNAVHPDTLHPSVTDTVTETAPAAKTRRTRARKEPKKEADKPKISAIDESLDSTNWLIATPPASRKAKAEADSAAAANEFGYQEPTRRQPPESPAQMLLW